MNTKSAPTLADVERAKINMETSILNWSELERFFAQGIILHIKHPLDLVDTAAKMSLDDTNSIALWQDQGLLKFVDDAQAITWSADHQELWAVVVKPYILVQAPIDNNINTTSIPLQ